MWGIVRRALLPLLVLAVGIAVLVYGVKKHTAHVFEEQEIEISAYAARVCRARICRPDSVVLLAWMACRVSPALQVRCLRLGAPPPELQKVKQKIFVGKDESEMAIVRDVTIGGLVLWIQAICDERTVAKPPSLCPT